MKDAKLLNQYMEIHYSCSRRSTTAFGLVTIIMFLLIGFLGLMGTERNIIELVAGSYISIAVLCLLLGQWSMRLYQKALLQKEVE